MEVRKELEELQIVCVEICVYFLYLLLWSQTRDCILYIKK